MSLVSLPSRILKFTKSIADSKPMTALSKKYQNSMGYRKMGLRLDDMIPEENGIIQEAIHRLSVRLPLFSSYIWRSRESIRTASIDSDAPSSRAVTRISCRKRSGRRKNRMCRTCVQSSSRSRQRSRPSKTLICWIKCQRSC
jgi:hypothetical protein